MKFNQVMRELNEHVGRGGSHKMDVQKPSDAPKKVIAYDTGVGDRGVTGFPSDLKVLTQKEIVGTKKDNDGDGKKKKKGKKK